MEADSVNITDTTQATSTTTGALTVAGGISTQQMYTPQMSTSPGVSLQYCGGDKEDLFIFGGSDKRDYNRNATIKYIQRTRLLRKDVAHLVESDAEVSTLSLECGVVTGRVEHLSTSRRGRRQYLVVQVQTLGIAR